MNQRNTKTNSSNIMCHFAELSLTEQGGWSPVIIQQRRL